MQLEQVIITTIFDDQGKVVYSNVQEKNTEINSIVANRIINVLTTDNPQGLFESIISSLERDITRPLIMGFINTSPALFAKYVELELKSIQVFDYTREKVKEFSSKLYSYLKEKNISVQNIKLITYGSAIFAVVAGSYAANKVWKNLEPPIIKYYDDTLLMPEDVALAVSTTQEKKVISEKKKPVKETPKKAKKRKIYEEVIPLMEKPIKPLAWSGVKKEDLPSVTHNRFSSDEEAILFFYKLLTTYNKTSFHKINVLGVLGQISIESGLKKDGEISKLAHHIHNILGIKTFNPDDPHVKAKDDDRDSSGKLIHSSFKIYKNYYECIVSYGNFIRKDRYKGVEKYTDNSDYYKYVYFLQKRGYCTDPDYPKNVGSRIRTQIIPILKKNGLI